MGNIVSSGKRVTSKSETTVVNGAPIKIVNQALDRYFNTDSKSTIVIRNGLEIFPQQDYFNGILAEFLVFSFPATILQPADSLDLLLFERHDYLLAKFVLHVTYTVGTTVVFVFQVIIGDKQFLVSPFLPASPGRGELHMPCNNIDISHYLRRGDAVAALVRDGLPRLFSVHGRKMDEAYKWTQSGASIQFEIVKRSEEGREYYWMYTQVGGIASLVDNPGKALLAELNYLPGTKYPN